MIELYPWQIEDVQKLETQTGRLNAIEMGGGKTYEAGKLSSDLYDAELGRQLWIGPLGTLVGSRDKLLDMGIDLPMTIIDRKNRNGSWNKFVRGERGIFFCHWEALRLISGELSSTSWDHVVADEIHKIQNRKAQQTRALKAIRKVGYKTALSGTPVTGSTDKYWSVFNWLYPREYGSYWNFYNDYVSWHHEQALRGGKLISYRVIDGPKNEAQLLDKIRPYYVRHLKKKKCCERHPEGVMPWLPDKYYDPPNGVIVELGNDQRRAYEEMRKNMLAWVGQHQDEPVAAPILVAQMTRLQQFSGSYATVNSVGDVKMSEPSSKLDAVMDIILNNDSDKTYVIWSQFKQLVYLLQERCRKAGVSILLYTGDNTNVRDENVRRFARGEARVFAGTIASGGTGVDGLQGSCHTMIFLDRLWNPALNQQAEDRLWRDGQKNAVQIIDIQAENTIDAGKAQKIELTWSWIRRVLGDLRFSPQTP